jgi:multiple sugar transport system permease protein
MATATIVSPASRRGGNLHLNRTEARSAWLLVVPLAVLYALFFALPLVMALVESLQTTTRSGLGLGEATVTFAGLDNFIAVLSDPAIMAGFGRVAIIGLIQVPTMLLLALVMALLFDSTLVRFRQFFQTSAFLPHAIPGVIGAMLWAFLYLPGVSPILQGLSDLGIDVDVLGPHTVLFAVINITTWSWIGYNMIIIYAALQSIPETCTKQPPSTGPTGSRSLHASRCRSSRPPCWSLWCSPSSVRSSSSPTLPCCARSRRTSTPASRRTSRVYTLAMSENRPELAAALSLIIALLAFVLSAAVLSIRSRRSGKGMS